MIERTISTTPHRTFLALSLVGAAWAPGFAAAQAAAPGATAQGTEEASLGSVTVTDTVIVEEPGGRPDSPKYTAPLVDTPRSITIIPSQLLEDTQSTTLKEALRTIPGITFGAGEGGNPLGDRPVIRGFDSQNSLYIDGVRAIGAATRETFAVEQIEVVKGSDSVTNGSGNAGGSINLISKQPKPDAVHRAEGSLGNADYKRVTVDLNQPLNDFIGIRLNAMYHDQDVAGRDAIFQRRWGVAPSLMIGLTGPTSLTLDYYHLHTNELPDSGIPYLYTLANAPAGVTKVGPALRYTTLVTKQDVAVPRGAFYGLVDRDFRKTDIDQASVRFRHAFDNGFVLRNTSLYSHSSQDYIWTQPDDSQGNVANTGQVWRRANTRYSDYDSLTNQTDLSGKFKTGTIEHSFAASLEYNWQDSAFGTFVSNPAAGTAIATGSTINPRCNADTIARFYCTTVAAPNPRDPWVSYTSDTSTVATPIVRSLPKTQTLTHADSYSASLFDTITLTDWLLVNLGGRYDHVKTTASAGLVATSTATRTWITKTNDLWTYQAGVVVKPAANASLYVSTAKSAIAPGSFLAQGAEDNGITGITPLITANDFKVQRTISYEAGAKWALFDEGLLLTLDVFQTKTNNARTANPDGTLSYVGTRRIRGVEVGYTGNVTPRWSIFGGYAFMPSKVLNAGLTTTTLNGVSLTAPAAATGHPFPNTPRQSFTTFTSYKVTPALTIGGGAIYMDRVYGSFTDQRTIQNGAVVITKTRATYVPSYWRFDANASFQINQTIGLRINALNITDKRYFDQAYPTHYANQAAGRTVIGTLSLRL